MNSDVFFRISHEGGTHPVCQDYARCGEMKFTGRRYAILADGCSFAPDTDVGARLVVLAAESQLKTTGLLDMHLAAHVAKMSQRNLDVPQTCLQATLLAAWHDDYDFHALICGDGFVVARQKTGDMVCHKVEWSSGAPLYPIYTTDPSDLQEYRQQFCGPKHRLIRSTLILPAGGGDPEYTEVERPAETNQHSFSWQFSRSSYDLVAVASDGMASFRDHSDPARPLVAADRILREIFAIKGYAGKFVLRRGLRAFESFAEKQWYNADDFSVGMVVNNG